MIKVTSFIVNHSESKLEHLTSEVFAMWGQQTPTQTLVPVPRLAIDTVLFEIDAIAVIPVD